MFDACHEKTQLSSHPMRKDVAHLLRWCIYQGGRGSAAMSFFSRLLFLSPKPW